MKQKELIPYLERGRDLVVCEPTYEGDTWTCQICAQHDGEEGKDGSDADGHDGIFITIRQATALISKGMEIRRSPNIYSTVRKRPKKTP